MTWYADEIILPGTQAALAEIQRHPLLRAHAFHARTTEGHDWHREDIVHDLTDEGLIFIQPVCDLSSHAASWHDLPVLDWTLLVPSDGRVDMLNDAVTTKLVDYLDEEYLPPVALRQFLAQLATQLLQPVLYYGCGMWGGHIESEYCLVYSPREALFCTNPEDRQFAKVDALCKGLSEIGLHLPTSYFAPHTRGFEWSEHKIDLRDSSRV
jgi:hypothetical protein